MDDIELLELNDVLLIHIDQISRYGGEATIRDLALLESAIAQPQAGFGGELLHAFPFEMAAAYLFHIVMNHPFADGNKRTGTVAALVFLDWHGIEISAESGELAELGENVRCPSVNKLGSRDCYRNLAVGLTWRRLLQAPGHEVTIPPVSETNRLLEIGPPQM